MCCSRLTSERRGRKFSSCYDIPEDVIYCFLWRRKRRSGSTSTLPPLSRVIPRLCQSDLHRDANAAAMLQRCRAALWRRGDSIFDKLSRKNNQTCLVVTFLPLVLSLILTVWSDTLTHGMWGSKEKMPLMGGLQLDRRAPHNPFPARVRRVTVPHSLTDRRRVRYVLKHLLQESKHSQTPVLMFNQRHYRTREAADGAWGEVETIIDNQLSVQLFY